MDLNARDADLLRFGGEIVTQVRSFMERTEFAFEVRHFTSPEALAAAFDSAVCDYRILFSNFAPNGTYGVEPPEPKRIPVPSGRLGTIPADGYDKTKRLYTSLLADSENCELHVITGAPFEKLSNFEIVSVAPECFITVQRRHEWLKRPNYHSVHLTYIINTLMESLARLRGQATLAQPAHYASQFTRLRCLILYEKRDGVPEAIARSIAAAYGQMSFEFVLATPLEAHEALMRMPYDIAFVLDPAGELCPLMETIANGNPEMPLFYVTSRDPNHLVLPPSAVLFHRHSLVSFEFSLLAEAFVRMADRLCGMSGDVPLDGIRRRYAELVTGDPELGFDQANRALVRMESAFLRRLRMEEGVTFFVPFDRIGQLGQLAALLPFVAPRSVLSYTGFSHSSEEMAGLHGQEVRIVPLWYQPRREYAFAAPTRLAHLIREHATLLEAGNVQFFPSPNLCRITADNAAEFSLESKFKGVFEQAPGTSVWNANIRPEDQFPVAAIDAEFGCDSDGLQGLRAEWIVDGLRIPYITSSQPAELAKLLRDEAESVAAFRNHTAAVLQSFARASSEEDLRRQAKRFRRDLTEGACLLRDRIERLQRTSRIILVSGTVLTATVTISTILGVSMPEPLASFAGKGGAVGVLTQLLNYRSQLETLRRERQYFLWKLGQSRIQSPADR